MLLRRSIQEVLRTNTSSRAAITCLIEQRPRYQSSASASKTKSAQSSGGAASTSKEPISSCPAGTVLSGLNIYKDRPDPVARPDAEYPTWLWTLLDSTKASSDGAVLESTEGLTKGQARIVEKRNVRAIRAAQRAKQMAAARASDSNAQTPAMSGAGMRAVGQSSQGILSGASGDAEAKAGDAATAVEVLRDEREQKRQLRSANRADIKAKNFVKGR